MIALMRKDLRIYRAAFIAAAIAICLPILLAILQYLLGNFPMPRPMLVPQPGTGVTATADSLQGIFAFGIGLTVIAAAIFGGTAFSIERRDRSAEFLAMLPASRSTVALSKLLVSFAILLPWIINSGVMFVCQIFNFHSGIDDYGFGRSPQRIVGHFYEIFGLSGAVIAAAFGVAWLSGVLSRSPTIASCIGLFFVFVWLWGFVLPEAVMEFLLIATGITVGIIGTLAGVLISFKRVSP